MTSNTSADTSMANGALPTSSTQPEHVLEQVGIRTDAVNAGVVSDYKPGSTAAAAAAGEVVTSFCPSTGASLAQVETVRPSPP